MLQSVAIFAGDKTSHKCLEQLFLFAESNWAAIEEEEQNNENNGSPTPRGKISSDLSIVFVIGNFTTIRNFRKSQKKVSHSTLRAKFTF